MSLVVQIALYVNIAHSFVNTKAME